MSLFKRNSKHKKKALSIQEERERLLTPESDFFIREAYKTLRTKVSFSLTGEEKSKQKLKGLTLGEVHEIGGAFPFCPPADGREAAEYQSRGGCCLP